MTPTYLTMKDLATQYNVQPERRGYIPYATSTIWKMIKEGRFPKPHKLGKKCVWLKSDIDDWLSQNVQFKSD